MTVVYNQIIAIFDIKPWIGVSLWSRLSASTPDWIWRNLILIFFFLKVGRFFKLLIKQKANVKNCKNYEITDWNNDSSPFPCLFIPASPSLLPSSSPNPPNPRPPPSLISSTDAQLGEERRGTRQRRIHSVKFRASL